MSHGCVLLGTDKNLISKTHTINCPFSDHCFVVAVLNLKPSKSCATLINSRLISQSKLLRINEMIILIPFGCIEMAETVEYKFYFFKKLIMDIVNKFTPLKSVRLKNNSLPWFDQELISLFRKRDKLYELENSFDDKTHQTWKSFVEFRNFC